jgi:hypothetical protein
VAAGHSCRRLPQACLTGHGRAAELAATAQFIGVAHIGFQGLM